MTELLVLPEEILNRARALEDAGSLVNFERGDLVNETALELRAVERAVDKLIEDERVPGEVRDMALEFWAKLQVYLMVEVVR